MIEASISILGRACGQNKAQRARNQAISGLDGCGRTQANSGEAARVRATSEGRAARAATRTTRGALSGAGLLPARREPEGPLRSLSLRANPGGRLRIAPRGGAAPDVMRRSERPRLRRGDADSRTREPTSGQSPRRFKRLQMASTLALVSESMSSLRPHSRLVSPSHLSVASKPIFEPKPETGEAKSR